MPGATARASNESMSQKYEIRSPKVRNPNPAEIRSQKNETRNPDPGRNLPNKASDFVLKASNFRLRISVFGFSA